MKQLILILLLCMPFLGTASHIVGGEFELRHLGNFRYQVRLHIYFDEKNGLPGNKDQDKIITARIFRYSDNAVMQDIAIPFKEEILVNYTSTECAVGELKTSKMIYYTEMVFPQALYSDPQGYFIIWERCCRNYKIKNIYSENPRRRNGSINPDAKSAGQTFYLKFPPVVKDGRPFINSTPRLFPPLRDYGCPNKPYYVDFSGSDDDGDSLVYSLVTPYNTHNSNAYPAILSAPYPEITWRPSYSLQNIMGGTPDLEISNEGQLTITPVDTGLFVFAVKCNEYRGGIKIGEVRRDFQMLVRPCSTAVAPVIKGKKLTDTEFGYRESMNITFPYSITSEERCIEVQVSDLDILNDLDGFTEKIKIRARAVGNKANINEVKLPTIKSAILNQINSTATFKICFDECPLIPNTPYQILIIASDDACALPLLDTLRITVDVQTPPNVPARFIEPDQSVIESLNEGDAKKLWPVKVVDDDGDMLDLSYRTDGFNLAGVGMDFDFSQPIQGIIEDTLSWNPTCDKYDFSVKRNFLITLFADDGDLCNYNKPDSVQFNLTLIPPPNADPVIDTDITLATSERFVDGGTPRIFETVEFNVFGHDDDVGYPITLQAAGIGFQLIDYKIDFPSATGFNDIASHFAWPLECALFDLSKKDSFNIQFIVVDKSNKCKIYQADTVNVGFKIRPPINTPPEIAMQNMHPETTSAINAATSFWGNPIEFLLTGTDADEAPPMTDNIKLEMIKATGNVAPVGYSFVPVTGQKNIESKFIWSPDCSVFKDNVFLNTYEFQFRVFDDHCQSALADTINLTLNVKDFISTDEAFLPVNAITPNADNKNDFFALDGYDLRDDTDHPNPNEEIGLPLDNCLNRFEYITIYNRWGKQVFTSNNRYFRWYAPEAAAGVYFYFLKFTNKDYKGSVLVRF